MISCSYGVLWEETVLLAFCLFCVLFSFFSGTFFLAVYSSWRWLLGFELPASCWAFGNVWPLLKRGSVRMSTRGEHLRNLDPFSPLVAVSTAWPANRPARVDILTSLLSTPSPLLSSPLTQECGTGVCWLCLRRWMCVCVCACVCLCVYRRTLAGLFLWEHRDSEQLVVFLGGVAGWGLTAPRQFCCFELNQIYSEC